MAIYDVTVPIRSGMPIYEGDPPVKIEAASSLASGDSANVSFLHFGAHTGTHVDAPAHFIEGAAKIDSLPLDVLIGPARVIHVPEDRTEIDSEFLSSGELEDVQRIIFRTRNSNFWNGEGFRKDFTHLLPEAAELLVNRGVKLVGIDYLSIEKFHSGHHRTHIALLSRAVVIVEGLNLSGVPAGDYELICLPLKIAEGAGDGAPARVVLRTLSDKL
ncbi:MAG TPA: cyclase family protein [Pyrinomonadaceae bacterium]|nr:cyclase family protein [Pyrinomonadaceae bacterium]